MGGALRERQGTRCGVRRVERCGLQKILHGRVRGGLYCNIRGLLKSLPLQEEVTDKNILGKANVAPKQRMN